MKDVRVTHSHIVFMHVSIELNSVIKAKESKAKQSKAKRYTDSISMALYQHLATRAAGKKGTQFVGCKTNGIRNGIVPCRQGYTGRYVYSMGHMRHTARVWVKARAAEVEEDYLPPSN